VAFVVFQIIIAKTRKGETKLHVCYENQITGKLQMQK